MSQPNLANTARIIPCHIRYVIIGNVAYYGMVMSSVKGLNTLKTDTHDSTENSSTLKLHCAYSRNTHIALIAASDFSRTSAPNIQRNRATGADSQAV